MGGEVRADAYGFAWGVGDGLGEARWMDKWRIEGYEDIGAELGSFSWEVKSHGLRLSLFLTMQVSNDRSFAQRAESSSRPEARDAIS